MWKPRAGGWIEHLKVIIPSAAITADGSSALLAVPIDKLTNLYRSVNSPRDLPELTLAQIAYAATDAWVCRELYLKFESSGLIDKTH